MSEKNIEKLRKEIDEINKKIIELIDTRMEKAEIIGSLKKEKGAPMHQPDRESKIIQNCKKEAKERNIEEEKIEKIFKTIISISRERQMKESEN